jgi:uncharacterized protein
MIYRTVQRRVEAALQRQAAVAVLGPRQSGKTTLALNVAEGRPSVYLDLESSADRQKLENPAHFLEQHIDRLVILDEIYRVPELFDVLRGVIDRGRRINKGKGRFIILGSASIELMRQSESLAGRIEYVDLGPLHLLEVGVKESVQRDLWVRGGFPDSFLAGDDRDSMRLRQSFIRTYLERDVPMFGQRVAAETLERFWTMLAHNQGTLLNASRLASGLGVSSPTISNYVGLLVDLLLVRRLPPLLVNVGKRLVKSPKTFIRDSGLTHALLGIETYDDLLGHPVVGLSWEGFVLENLLANAPLGCKPSFYRTAKGSEVDLILELGAKHGVWAVEIKHSMAPKLKRGFHLALEDLQPNRSFVVYPGEDRYTSANGIEVIGLAELAALLTEL